ncbi:MAG: acetyltransferase [bacterium]|nr:acetyltransferase [bacterium]
MVENLKPLVIFGAGGFGREVAWLVDEINGVSPEWELLGFVDDRATGHTTEGVPILGPVAHLNTLKGQVWVVLAVGDSRARYRLARELEDKGFPFATLVHPSVRMSGHVRVEQGSIVCAGCILTTNIRIGRNCIINPGCFIGHDTRVGDFSSLMPGVNLAGDVIVGTGCYFGLNACAINRVTIGEWSVIGAGATVIRDIPPRVVAVGVPAKPVRTLEDAPQTETTSQQTDTGGGP